MELGNWVPQVFYDLIGRVVPGGALSVLAFWLFQDGDHAKQRLAYLFKDSGIPSSLIVIGGLVISYTLGILLGAFAFAVVGREWRPGQVSSVTLVLPEKEVLGPASFSYAYDAIQLYNPLAGARLAKLQAEQHMCRVLIVGFLLLAVGRVVSRLKIEQFDGLILGLLSIGILGAYLLHIHLAIRSRRLLVNNWHLLQEARGGGADSRKGS